MNISPTEVRGKTTREILHELIEYVVTSDDEMTEKRTRSGERTDLNVYLCDNQDYEAGSLDYWITHIAESGEITGRASSYVAEHTFSETVADDTVSLVTITTPRKNREDEFVFVTNNGYLWVLTTVHSDWRDKTIERLLRYLPCVERLYLSSDDLETLTRRIDDSSVSGFTAKYHAPHRERDATLQFSGAEPDDLETAEEAFDAKPTRIEFDQTNSPSTAIQGASTNEGRLTMRSVRRGSEGKAVETLLDLTGDYQRLDRQSFAVDQPSGVRSGDEGFRIDGFTAVELTDPDRQEVTPSQLLSELEATVLNGSRYQYARRDDGQKVRVFDTEHDETFDLALEPPDLVLYARHATTAASLRSFVRDIYDDFDSTYTLNRVETTLG